jgi:hypothetical protein
MKNIIFKIKDTLCVIRLGKTSNEKISAKNETIVQTYHFSKNQFVVAQVKTTMREFFSFDGPVCLDCPFAVSNGAKLSDCYTHKVMQYSGFISMLRSIGKKYTWDEIPELNKDIERDILRASTGRYIRFGTYGEPSLLPIELTRTICAVAKNWTGYTHQYNKRPEFSPFFMASTHDAIQEQSARDNNWRSFVASPTGIEGLVSCPASKEQNYKSNCSKCGLCSGTQGKGNKSIVILQH